MSGPRVLFYVQHLLGIGHLARASRIAEALKQHGLGPVLAIGGFPAPGFPPPGIDATTLPALRSDAGFRTLLTATGEPANPAFLDARRRKLLDTLVALKPDLVVTEAFPFGRRQMRFELLPLLEAARSMRPRPRLVVSVRDIVQPARKPGRVAETLSTLAHYYDLVLVHGDPHLVRFEESFPEAPRIAPALSYTGLVTGGPPRPSQDKFAVVVSTGGGVAQGQLLETALAARPETELSQERWCFITGPNAPRDLLARLETKLGTGDLITPFRADFPALLASARLSISQAGYNSCGDILEAGTASVLVPYAQAGEIRTDASCLRIGAPWSCRVAARVEAHRRSTCRCHQARPCTTPAEA